MDSICDDLEHHHSSRISNQGLHVPSSRSILTNEGNSISSNQVSSTVRESQICIGG